MRRKIIKIFTLSAFLMLQMPLWRLLLYAFNDAGSGKFTHFSLRWFKEFWSTPVARDAFLNSLCVSFLAATLCVVMALLFVYVGVMGYARKSVIVRQFSQCMTVMPEMFPALGAFFLMGCVGGGITYSLLDAYILIVWMGALCCLGPTMIMISGLLSTVMNEVFQAAQDLGAGPSYAFWRVLFPMMFPSIAGIWVISMVWVMDDFLITLFLGGGRITNMQSYMYFLEQGDPSVIVNVMASTTVLIFVVLGLFLYLVRKSVKFSGRLSYQKTVGVPHE